MCGENELDVVSFMKFIWVKVLEFKVDLEMLKWFFNVGFFGGEKK